MSRFTSHPFAVEAHFEYSLVLAYSFPKEVLEPLLPPGLALDLHQDSVGFLAVALVSTRGLRPRGFPAIFGQDFVLAGYRLFVRYNTSQGRNLRGLYILGSETDSLRMKWAGNIFTHYRYAQNKLVFERFPNLLTVRGEGLEVTVDPDSEAPLPKGSVFKDWKAARRFAGPMPFTFSRDGDEMIIIEGVRSNWKPRPVTIKSAEVGFIDRLGLQGGQLSNAFIIEDIPYWWKKGERDPCPS
ncbi:DUF2071 domain-containing protein [Bradymonas sediminis]|uniref:Uncharacterized protein n=1 Tax=Bradymonas sediminis TaxID=1548548 RepID=A0A2Z4FMS1_9DELT|nr:DUF2071 domain-containing protein [Bradymonas sediminis]AWV90287.1 hypothetical protein DN745_13480 [Bradymonas sediminis]TDP75744.1 uncharacterized protein DUF2071 [Bradymonas sediminis]